VEMSGRLSQIETSNPMLLGGVRVSARVDQRCQHRCDFADGGFCLLGNKCNGMRELVLNLFNQFATPHLSFLESKNSDTNRCVCHVLGYLLQAINFTICCSHERSTLFNLESETVSLSARKSKYSKRYRDHARGQKSLGWAQLN